MGNNIVAEVSHCSKCGWNQVFAPFQTGRECHTNGSWAVSGFSAPEIDLQTSQDLSVWVCMFSPSQLH